jgi:Zn-dependent M28 family amino/carboxypeptidase
MKKAFSLIGLCTLLASCAAQMPQSSLKSAPFALDQARYKADLKAISSDEFAGRAPGAIGEERFVPWLEAQFKGLGLAPGNGTSFLQAVPMTEISNTITESLSFKRGGDTIALSAGKDYVLSSRRLDDSLRLDASEMIFMGYGVDQANENWNDYSGVDVKGKTVVVLINDPGFHVADPDLFKGKAMTYAGRWMYKFEEAARKGAAACLIIHDDKGAAYPWAVVQNGAARPEFELPPKPGQIQPLLAQGWIRGDVASSLFANAGLDFEALRKAASVRGFKPVPLGTTASAAISHVIKHKTSQNVAALVRGSERPDEVVIYSAHWDHLGQNPSLVGDQIFNGAIDNGTGVAGLLELGRAMQASKPKRSVLLLAVTLEESGLLGSKFYAENPIFPLNKTVANLNMDAMPLIGPSKDVVVIGIGNSELENILTPLATAQGRTAIAEPTPENGFYFRSDHFNFAKVGVPALYIKTGPTNVEKGADFGKAWMDKYNAERYHKPSDEYDDSADYRGLMQDLELLRDIGLTLANSSKWPNWFADSEFRARRDAMMQ